MSSELHRKIAQHPVEVLLGARALLAARERRSSAPERAIFAAQHARDLQLPAVFLPNSAVGFSFYYPPLRGQPSLGKMGAFKDSDKKQIIPWVVDMLRRVEGSDWDGGRTLTGWNGGIITMMATPQPDAPNLMQLLVNWQSGIEGRRCAEFCSRLEDAYIAQGGYYDRKADTRAGFVPTASEKRHASDATVGRAHNALTVVIIMTVFSVPLAITQLPLILAYWELSDEMRWFISIIVFNNPFEYDNSVIHAVVTIPSLLVGAVLAKATWDRRDWVYGWIKPVIASLAIGPMIGGFVKGLLVDVEWWTGLAFGLLNYLLGLPACTVAVALSLMLSRFRFRGVAFLAVFCNMISTMLITGLSMSKQAALPLTWNSLLFLMVSYGIPSAVSAWVGLRMAGPLHRRT